VQVVVGIPVQPPSYILIEAVAAVTIEPEHGGLGFLKRRLLEKLQGSLESVLQGSLEPFNGDDAGECQLDHFVP
jgi:hypothetical protein